MAWGRRQPIEAPPASTLKKLLPLLITLALLAALGWVFYLVYRSLARIQEQARRQMMGDVVVSREGVRLNVRSMEAEPYLDRTQGWVVKAWNLASPYSASSPAYGSGSAASASASGGGAARHPEKEESARRKRR